MTTLAVSPGGTPALGDHVLRILLVRTQKQMFWVYAQPVVAPVTNEHSGWVNTVAKGERKAVYLNGYPVVPTGSHIHGAVPVR
jgi:hypothetical protein